MRIISAVNRLRSLAHIIDAHQLTKDPAGISKLRIPTEHSPQRTLDGQLDAINEMKMVLSKIKIDDVSKVIKLGSVIITDQANYYLAISAGELNISGKTYYAISPGSPIGKLLLGKYIGDSIIFNQKIVIEKIY